MAIEAKNPVIARALDAFKQAVGPSNGIPVLSKKVETTSESLSPEKQIFAYQAEALAMAKQMAADREKAYNEAKSAGLDVGKPENFKPTMTDYFLACEKLGEQKRDEMAEKGIPWKPEKYSNLSGHKLTGLQINKAHIEPSTGVKLTAALRAVQVAKAENRPIKNADILSEIGKIQRTNEKIDTTPETLAGLREEIQKSGVEGLEDVMDLDNNGTLAFYEKTNSHLDFKGTLFDHCSFHPAGTLMRDGENGIPWTQNASFVGCEFDGLGAQDTVVLQGNEFRDNHIINSNGGTVVIPDSTQVYDLTLGGNFNKFQVGHALVSGLKTEKARIIELQAASGAEIHHAVFDRVTISMNSQMANSKWADVTFNECNFPGVEMNGMNLTNVAFNNCSQVDLSGAKIGQNVAVNGTLLTSGMSQEQLAALGVTMDGSTQFIGVQPSPALAQAPPAADIDPRLAAVRAAVAPIVSTVKVAGTAPEGEAQQTVAINSMKKQVDPSQVASPGDRFMERNQGQENRQA